MSIPNNKKPNKPNLSGGNVFDLSDRHLEFALQAWQCIEGPFKIDYAKLGPLVGLNKESAAKQWSYTRKQLNVNVKPGYKAAQKRGNTGEDSASKRAKKEAEKPAEEDDQDEGGDV